MEKWQGENSWRFQFTPSNGQWVDYGQTPSGIRCYTMDEVLAHYGFSELLNVYGLTMATATNEHWHVRFREDNYQLITLFVSPAKDAPKSVRYTYNQLGLPSIAEPTAH